MVDTKLENVRKTFNDGQIVAVNDVDIHIEEGEFLVLVGPSGCGKSTTLRCIAGLEVPDSGTITFGGHDVTELPPKDRAISMVFVGGGAQGSESAVAQRLRASVAGVGGATLTGMPIVGADMQRMVRRELLREGQAFWVHNQIATLPAAADFVRQAVPGARVAVAHGQMDEDTLEQIMLSFWRREYDVLVCTTIVESGLDIPNANTLVVERSDLMGLAQLYQLREPH